MDHRRWLERLLIALVGGLAVWDGVAFVVAPPDLTGAFGLFLQVGALASVVFGLAGAVIAMIWPAARPAQLLGWCMSLAAFTWIDITLVPLSPELLPYRKALASLGQLGAAISFADRVSLFLLMTALARFALLFPRPLAVSQIPTGAGGWRELHTAGTRVTSAIDRTMKLWEVRGLRWLPSWLTAERLRDRPPMRSLAVWRWVIERPGQVWMAAAAASLLVAPGSAAGVEWLTEVAWVLEFFVLFLLGGVFGLALRLQYSVASEQDRHRLLWIVEGTTIACILYFLWAVLFLTTDVVPEAFGFAIAQRIGSAVSFVPTVYELISCWLSPMALTILCALAAAAFYQGAVDPRLVIRRTTVYGALGVVFLFIFAGLGNAAEGVLESWVGLAPFAGAVVTGGTIAVALIPVKRRLDRFVNRILPATTLAEAPSREVAILFSDLVGFAALTGADEKTGLTVMSVFHKAADRVAREHRGRFVKAVADEVMLEFASADDAVRAGAELREEFHEAARKLDLPTPEVCTGIHFGPATRSSEGDLFGDAVNVASRVQGMAGPGQIVLSGAVRERLHRDQFPLEHLEAKSLKNIAVPVECYRLAHEGG